MAAVVYLGTAVDVSHEPDGFQIDERTGKPLKNKPPLRIKVTRKPIEVYNLRGVKCPKGQRVDVDNDTAWKALHLGCFDVFGDVKEPKKQSRAFELPKPRPIKDAPPAAAVAAPALSPAEQVVDTKEAEAAKLAKARRAEAK